MKLANLLSTDQIILDMKESEHWSAIVELVDQLITCGKLPKEMRAEILEALKLREEQVSTGVGSGVAIPHAFSDDLEQVIAILGRSRAGIDFESLDGAPVHFVFLFIVPRKNYHMHLSTLAAIAKMFTNQQIRQRLGEAETHDDILAIIDPKQNRVSAAAQ